MGAIERRVAWQAFSLALTFAFAGSSSDAALWVLALLVIVGFFAHSAIDAHRHPTTFPRRS